jgi:hypothetical protein
MRGAHFGMKWFRSNIRYGSRFALFALVVQFVLSFGHFHGLAAQAAPAIVSVQQQQAPDNDSGHHPGDICAICAVMSLANTVMFATPPLLSLPQVAEFLYQTTEAEFVHLRSARIAFQPRAPPIS